MSSVSLRGVSKSYGGSVAVRDVNLEISEGEFIVLLGPSGCGKTTTLRMIAGFVDPTAGQILLGGKDVTRLPPRKRDIGMVFQNYALFPNMNVAENIAFGLRRRGAPRETIKARVEELLDLVHLSSQADYHIDELSGGQQQRVALARALAHTPSVLLMDEPLGALDLKLREQLQEEILRIKKTLGITTILVTHDQQEAMALADRIVLMDKGEIRQAGTADNLYRRPASPFVAGFIGKRNEIPADVAGMGDQLIARASDGTILVIGLPDDHPLGGKVTINLRPEHLILSREPGEACSDHTSLSATVTGKRFLGNVVHYELTLPWGEAVLSESRDGDHAVGDSVFVSFAHSDIVMFPEDSAGRRK
ncbi:ABC transporter ATP-binding protein [Futiania mangrovi]|uniref:ABC transporter ATP-binding protein n=1 Tax=Futiania mangrovi TaxID=2959716 RepID=A0A9J6PFB2_9PROT|nr:ABC transporter ATP-binding protein [Futiania mangrovii]MCP1337150.1 ABC transporter ATP-binding protein [Futiania mangrovii]